MNKDTKMLIEAYEALGNVNSPTNFVYVVILSEKYEGNIVLGIYSSKEKAQAAIKTTKDYFQKTSSLRIVKKQIDDEIDILGYS